MENWRGTEEQKGEEEKKSCGVPISDVVSDK